jgi:hypothetical protein
VDIEFYNSMYYNMLFSSSFKPLSIIVDYTPQNIRRQLISEIMTNKDTADGFRPCQISTSVEMSYGVLSLPTSRAIIVVFNPTDSIKTERCCSSGTGTDTDSATGSDDSNDKFEVQDDSIHGDQDNVLTHMDINTAAAINTSDEISSDAIDLGISGENMSALRDMEFRELAKLVSDSDYMLSFIECVFNHAVLLKNTACLYAA